MKRVLIAASLGGLLLVGTPTLALSAQRNDSKAERSADNNKGGDNKGGNKSGDNKGGDRGDRADRGDRRDDRDRDGGRSRNRHGYYRDGYYGGGYWYGEPQDCWYGPNGAYNCEPYGGDYYPGYSGGYRGYRSGSVVVQGSGFSPPEVSVRPGEELRWIFEDREPHTVTADNKSFDSGQRVNDEYRLRFDQPGSYSYHCAIHPEMKGRVIVQP